MINTSHIKFENAAPTIPNLVIKSKVHIMQKINFSILTLFIKSYKPFGTKYWIIKIDERTFKVNDINKILIIPITSDAYSALKKFAISFIKIE